jgi:uncharacterized protein (UPF0264 family)
VQSLAEAKSLASCMPDILDLKNPAQGALGALELTEVRAIVDWVDRRTLSSATIGDLPMNADVIAPAISAMADTGVDYVKVGLFADHNFEACLMALQPTLASIETPVIAVLFADQGLQENVELIRQSGFAGIMVDTAIKDGKRLTDHWTHHQLAAFVEKAHEMNMLCGLAGALAIEDIASLKSFNADYLGFRSALCEKRQRSSCLQSTLASKVAQALQADISMAS